MEQKLFLNAESSSAIKKIRAFYGIRSFNTAFMRTHHQTSPVHLLEDKNNSCPYIYSIKANIGRRGIVPPILLLNSNL
jgi:hypothetical protein